MCLRSYLEEQAALMGPGQSISLTRETIEWMLATHGVCECSNDQPGAVDPEQERRRRMSTADIARLTGRGMSTVGGWIAAGKYGDPDHLKPNGRDYEVSARKVEEVLEKEEAGWRFVRGEWIAPVGATVQPPSRDRARPRLSGSGERAVSGDDRSRRGRYGSWKVAPARSPSRRSA